MTKGASSVSEALSSERRQMQLRGLWPLTCGCSQQKKAVIVIENQDGSDYCAYSNRVVCNRNACEDEDMVPFG